MRIGAVSYLNTKPLVYGLERRLAPRHELVFDLPSRLADGLAAGTLDVALIPSVEFFQNPDYQIVSDACIGCRGPVRSVKLLSRVPARQIRTLALDEGSRTSAALVQILLRERFGLTPRLVPFPIDAAAESIEADALLMIGDRAMHPSGGTYCETWDLGDVWNRWAELPFVFAMWVARGAGVSPAGEGSGFRVQGSGSELDDLAELLAQARDAGVANLDEIAAREHEAVGLPYDDCLAYLRDHLHFYLGPRELASLKRFRACCGKLGLISELAGTKPGPGSPHAISGTGDTGSKFAPG
jgi:chorismate dehydratase